MRASPGFRDVVEALVDARLQSGEVRRAEGRGFGDARDFDAGLLYVGDELADEFVGYQAAVGADDGRGMRSVGLHRLH